MQSITEILKGFDQPCPCGKKHTSALDMLVSGPGALARLPELLARYDAKKPFLLADRNTFAAAGGRVCEILTQAGFGYASYVFRTSASSRTSTPSARRSCTLTTAAI